jgi:hypothetical protein
VESVNPILGAMNLLLAVCAISLWLIFTELHKIRRLLQAKERPPQAPGAGQGENTT